MALIIENFVGAQETPFTSVPVGWTKYGGFERLTANGGRIWAANNGAGLLFGQMVYDAYTTGNREITATMHWNSASSSSEWCLCFLNTSRSGFSLIVRNASITLRKEVAGSPGAIIATLSTTNTADAVFALKYNDIGGAIYVKKDGVSVLTGTYTDTPTLRAGIQNYRASNCQTFSTVQVELIGAQAITSVNSGNPITVGQTGIPVVATGYTAKPTVVTATYASGAKSITATVDSGGSATNFNISIQDRIDAEDWPINGDTLNFTFTYLSETASKTAILVKESSEVDLTLTGVATTDPKKIGYHLVADGFTPEGGELVYTPYDNLVMNADGGGTVTSAGTFSSWFRPSTGTGAGNVYAYTWVITEAGISPAGSGLTSSGLTVSGLTIAGLTSSGL